MTANTLKAFPPVGFSRLGEEERGEKTDVVHARVSFHYNDTSLYEDVFEY